MSDLPISIPGGGLGNINIPGLDLGIPSSPDNGSETEIEIEIED